jgi:NAD(P)H-dependent flavin oxidoreductase YrpB (nitropropane dioxygenase family)
MARNGLADLLRHPVAVAPMAGGPSTAALVIAAARAGALGFLAAGAAAARGDTERMSLWAGQGYRSAAGQPAGEIIERLGSGV